MPQEKASAVVKEFWRGRKRYKTATLSFVNVYEGDEEGSDEGELI